MNHIPTDNSFVSLEAVKDYLGLSRDHSADDTVLNTLIAGVSAHIQSYVGRDLVQKTYLDTVDGNGTAKLWFRHTPIMAVQEVGIDGQVIPFTNYRFSDTTLYLKHQVFTPGVQNIELQYIAGFRHLPADITHLGFLLIGEYFKNKDRMNKVSHSIAGGSATFRDTPLAETFKNILAPYRRVTP